MYACQDLKSDFGHLSGFEMTTSKLFTGSRFGQSNLDTCQEIGNSKQNHEEDVHTHHNNIVADAGPNLQPAAIVTHQEKEVL